ncbi:MAG: hypothetical protein M3525_14360 [Acidobacteriota bacterium]|nr:hypothetical protein [Acidobacteriota bacterium]
MDNPFVIGIVSWLIPGLGHLLQKKWRRGIILGIVIWGMFIIALFSGGAYYPGFEFKDGTLLYLLNIFARLGNGLGAIISFLLVGSAPQNVAAWATFEYGGRFLEVAGLLNFLAVIDAVDIQQERKK